LAESTEASIRGKGLFSYRENVKKCIAEALDSLNIRRKSRKLILKEEQERARFPYNPIYLLCIQFFV